MKQLDIFCVALLGFLSLGGAPMEKRPDKPRIMDTQLKLAASQMTDEKISQLKHAALDGSWEVAAEFQNLFDYWFQGKESIFWDMVASEKWGHGASRYNLARTLAASPTRYSRDVPDIGSDRLLKQKVSMQIWRKGCSRNLMLAVKTRHLSLSDIQTGK